MPTHPHPNRPGLPASLSLSLSLFPSLVWLATFAPWSRLVLQATMGYIGQFPQQCSLSIVKLVCVNMQKLGDQQTPKVPKVNQVKVAIIVIVTKNSQALIQAALARSQPQYLRPLCLAQFAVDLNVRLQGRWHILNCIWVHLREMGLQMCAFQGSIRYINIDDRNY